MGDKWGGPAEKTEICHSDLSILKNNNNKNTGGDSMMGRLLGLWMSVIVSNLSFFLELCLLVTLLNGRVQVTLDCVGSSQRPMIRLCDMGPLSKKLSCGSFLCSQSVFIICLIFRGIPFFNAHCTMTLRSPVIRCATDCTTSRSHTMSFFSPFLGFLIILHKQSRLMLE